MANFTIEDSYEYTDFNRVENAISDVKAQFVKSNIPTKDLENPVTNWNIASLPVVSDFNRIERNLKTLDVAGVFKSVSWYEKKTFSFEDANRWEDQLELSQKLVQNIHDTWNYCGAYICGGGL